MPDSYTAAELLEAREKRVEKIQQLLKEYNVPLLVMRANYPGLQKTNPLTIKMVGAMTVLLGSQFQDKLCAKVEEQGAEGPVVYAAIKEDPVALKISAIDLEEKHPLGRCLDLDVYNPEGQSISRQDLGFPRRKCYLCGEDAHLCVRSKRHSEEAIIAFIEERFRDYMGRSKRAAERQQESSRRSADINHDE